MTAKGLKRVSPGIYRNKKGTLVNASGHRIRLPKNTHVVNKREQKQEKKKKQPEVRGRDVTISNSDVERQIIYGEMVVGGVFSFINTTGSSLRMVVTIAGHPIDSVTTLYLDHKQVIMGGSPDPRWATGIQRYEESAFHTFAGGPDLFLPDLRVKDKVFWAYMDGALDQVAQPDLLAESNALFAAGQKWTSNHRQRRCALVYTILVFDNDVFPDGIPDISFRVKGKKVYDPRNPTHDVNDSTTWTYSQNAVLIIADFLRDPLYGLAVEAADIDYANIELGANLCDEQVAVSGGGTEARYTINGVFDANATPQSILEEMAAAIGGDIVCQVPGVWRVFPAAWREPILDFTEDDARGAISIVTKVSKSDNFNRVKGKYIAKLYGYQPTDFDPVTNALYLSEDGEELWKEITLNFVTSSPTARRLARIELERVRQGIAVTFPTTLKALKLLPSDNITLTLEKYGWVAKPFEVRDINLDYGQDNGYTITLSLIETASGVYTDSLDETTIDIAPNTRLPSPFDVADPTSLTLASGTAYLYKRGDGTIVSRLFATWTAPDDDFVLSGGYVEIQYKRSADATWSDATDVPGTSESTYIYDVQDGQNYDVRIRSVNAIGIRSQNWVYALNHLVKGKTEPPSDVLGFRGSLSPFLINLSWAAVPDLDLAEYEITIGDTYEASTLVDRTKATSFTVTGRLAGAYKYWIKAIDTSRNYSLHPALVSLTIPAPDPPVASFRLDGSECVISWTVPTSFFAIAEYEVRQGDTFDSATVYQSTKATSTRFRVTWLGNRTFWVAARDIVGNLSAGSQVIVTIRAPDPVRDINVEVVDNWSFLTWTNPAVTSLPISRCRVFRGPNFVGAKLLGESTGTFHAIMETRAGQFTYWVQAVDTAGNVSVEKSRTALVTEPPDFILRTDQAIVPEDASVLDSIYIEGLGFLAPTPTSGIGTPLARRTGLLLLLRL